MVAASAASADFSRYSKPPPLGGGAFTGISGQDTPQSIPDIAVVIQFWFAEENAIPELVIMKKDAFMKFFHVQEE
jgi:hypothetical protein